MKFEFLPCVVASIVAMVFLRRICSSRPGDGEQRGQSLAALTARGRGLYCFQPQPRQPVLLRRGRRARCVRFPTCGVVRVAGYSVVLDCDSTSVFPPKITKRSAAAILGRSAPSLLVRFKIFCCRQISLLCFLRYHPILFLSISHLRIRCNKLRKLKTAQKKT